MEWIDPDTSVLRLLADLTAVGRGVGDAVIRVARSAWFKALCVAVAKERGVKFALAFGCCATWAVVFGNDMPLNGLDAIQVGVQLTDPQVVHEEGQNQQPVFPLRDVVVAGAWFGAHGDLPVREFRGECEPAPPPPPGYFSAWAEAHDAR